MKTLMHLSLAVVALNAWAQPSFQILLDIPPDDSTTVLGVFPSTNGAVICVFEDGIDSYVFRRFSATGLHEWSQRVQSPAFRNPWAGGGTVVPSLEWLGHHMPFAPDGNGGVIYCYPTIPALHADGIGLDTNITSTTIMLMDADGIVQGFEELHHELVLPADSLEPLIGTQHASFAVYPDGGLLVFEAYHSIWSQVIMTQATSILPAGDIAWTKWYYLPGGSITQGTLGDMGQLCWLIADTAGGAYLMDALLGRVAHFDASGQCEWVKSYFYDATAFPGSPGMMIDPVTNDLLVADDVPTWSGRKQTIVRISPLGDLADVTVFNYPPPLNNYCSGDERFGQLADGSLVIGENNSAPAQRETFTIIDPSGSTAQHFEPWPGSDPTYGFLQRWRTFASSEDHLLASGSCTVLYIPLGTTTGYPMVASFTLNTMGACLSTESTATAIPGLSVCSTLPRDTWLDVPAGQQTTLLPLPPPIVSMVSPPGIIDFCSFNVGMKEPGTSLEFFVHPSVLPPGENLMITAGTPGYVVIVAMDGRIERSFAIAKGTMPVSCEDLAPGAYTLIFRSADGAFQIPTRILVL